MSVMFGQWYFDRRPVEAGRCGEIKNLLSRYGSDGLSHHSGQGIRILCGELQTTPESQNEKLPLIRNDGAVMVWDGRLDNREDLLHEIDAPLPQACADVQITAAVYDKFGVECFSRLIGDWAVSIWEPKTCTLLLAKDPIGTRPLYFSLDRDQASWSSLLEALLVCSPKQVYLDEGYIAGWLSSFPPCHLTPYSHIAAVPPSSLVRIYRGSCLITKYWDFNSDRRIVYRSDLEYEEHFRSVFAQSVRRRLRARHPVLAELSGGMDSSSIVCMADRLLAQGLGGAPRLDTISYYDDTEPNWNERPYFSKVEELRGRRGLHIDRSLTASRIFDFDENRLAADPSSTSLLLAVVEPTVAASLESQTNRVMLSGIGGDEMLGGVPTPIPELEDAIARLRLTTLIRQLRLWALDKRKPWLDLLSEAIRSFLPDFLTGILPDQRPSAWIDPRFVARNRDALTGFRRRTRLFGPLPTFQENLKTLDGLRRQLACYPLPFAPAYEKRYPYLDRDLLEFVLAIPRDQLVRPGQRRSLMRRALTGIVPDEILRRKRKAFVVRGPSLEVADAGERTFDASAPCCLSSLGIIRPLVLAPAWQRLRDGQDIRLIPLLRVLALEGWLRSLVRHGFSPYLQKQQLHGIELPGDRNVAGIEARTFSAEKARHQRGGEMSWNTQNQESYR